jgi:tRNA pseudouridine38-40 synthase
MRIALGVSYSGSSYNGWQSQLSGNTIQDHLEKALAKVAGHAIRTHCSGRTDTGVHALMQVVHFDTQLNRPLHAWLGGANANLPKDIAIEWVREVPEQFHCRSSAINRRYSYILMQSSVRPSVQFQKIAWCYQELDRDALLDGAKRLLGEHDFSSFRASQCQALSPIKNISRIDIFKQTTINGAYWRFDFQANAFLHHMIRNIMGTLVYVGAGRQRSSWVSEVLEAKNRKMAAPTYSADGLYFLGPCYEEKWQMPYKTNAFDWLPCPESSFNQPVNLID